MPASSSADAVAEPLAGRAAALPFPRRALLLALNFLPLAHAAALALFVALPYADWGWKLAATAAGLYLLPPILGRAVLLLLPIRERRIAAGSRDFFAWWTLFQLQRVFCRFPALEELLRLVPGAYSLWLRLWGARIGRLTYWAAGMRILDRPFLVIGDDVVFGAGVRLNPHVLVKESQGQMQVLLAPVRIGDRALVGGYSTLTAGTEVAADEALRAFTISPPYSRWENGRRSKSDGASDADGAEAGRDRAGTTEQGDP